MTIEEKFETLGIDNAPGQESLQKSVQLELRGEKLEGPMVDFSHGDVDAHQPTPGSFERSVGTWNLTAIFLLADGLVSSEAERSDAMVLPVIGSNSSISPYRCKS